MADATLTITEPAHNTAFDPSDVSVTLRGELTGDGTGLFFKWFSSLNANATQEQPELNADHSNAALDFSAPMAEFGSHVVTLAAADQEGTDDTSLKAVTRAVMAGGAPPAAPTPCVVHRLVAQIRSPAADGANLSRADSTLEALAPGNLVMPDPENGGAWIRNQSYLDINAIEMQFQLTPQAPIDPTHTGEIPLPLDSTNYFLADDLVWLRWQGALPGAVVNGNYVLTLIASSGGKQAVASRNVILVP